MEDPLQYRSKSIISKNGLAVVNNSKGRPLKSSIIKFSPQPKSLISELLKKSNQSVSDLTRESVQTSVAINVNADNQEIKKYSYRQAQTQMLYLEFNVLNNSTSNLFQMRK